jgi:hypothetical protein
MKEPEQLVRDLQHTQWLLTWIENCFHHYSDTRRCDNLVDNRGRTRTIFGEKIFKLFDKIEIGNNVYLATSCTLNSST